jgi:hypothetical protein
MGLPARVLVRHEDLGQRALVQHRPAVVGRQRDDCARAPLVAHVELPLLPTDEAAVDREVLALRLRDANRLERGPQAAARVHRGLVEVLGLGRHRHHPGVQHGEHLAIVEVDDGLAQRRSAMTMAGIIAMSRHATVQP